MKNKQLLLKRSPINMLVSFKFLCALFAYFAFVGNANAQTYYNMSAANYSQNFTNIANTTAWPNGFNGTESQMWRGFASGGSGTIPTPLNITAQTNTFVTTTTGGVQRGTGNIQLLSTGATDNTSSTAIELYLNFTGRNAEDLTFDAAQVNNGSGNRVGTLRVYASVDNTNFTELTATDLPFSATNNVSKSAAISVALPSSFNNSATARLRFYYHNGTGGSTGSRPKISIDNLVVSSTAGGPILPTLTTPTATNIKADTATLGANLTADGGATITERGTVYGTSANPTGNDLDEGSTALGVFSHTRVPFTPNTKYIYRGYAINSVGTGYSPDGEFTTLPLAPTVGAGNNETTTSFVANWAHPTMGTEAYTYTLEVSEDNTFTTVNATITNIASTNDSYTVTGLTSTTDYYYRVRAVNTTGASAWSSASAVVTTLTPSCTAPTTSATAFGLVEATSTSLEIEWTRGDGDAIMIIAREGSAVTALPVDGTSYTADANFGAGDEIGTGNFVVYKGSASDFVMSSLNTATTYHFALYEYTSATDCYDLTPLTGNATTKAIYTWTGATNNVFTTATNWNPNRTTTSNDDVLIFDLGSSISVTGVPTQTITQLIIANSGTFVTFQAVSSSRILTIIGDTGDDLIIEPSAGLNISGTNTLSVSLASGATASIEGAVLFTNGAHRLLTTDANSINFKNGSSCTTGAGFSGNIFGTGPTGGVQFENGSTYIFIAGSNPFNTNNVCTFQTGSLYKHQSTNAPSFSGRTYANFELDLVGSVASTGGTPVTIDNITITNGTFGLNLNGGANINGNIAIASGATLNMSPSGTATVNFTGAATQTITNNGTLNVSNVNWNVNGAGLSLNSQLDLARNLTLTNGNITTTSKIVLTGASSTLNETGGKVIGRIETTRTVNMASTETFGNIGISITPNASNMGSTLVSRVTGDALQGGIGPIIDNSANLSIERYFEVTPTTNTGLNADVVITYDDSDLSFAESNLVVYKRDIAGTNWKALTTVNHNTSNNTIAVNVDEFSVIAPGDIDAPLPVKWLNFSAQANGKTVQLSWSTVSEINNDYFEVQHSINGREFTSISKVAGNGTTSETKKYSAIHHNPANGTNYYRINQVDFNGESSFSKLVQVAVSGQNISIFPNPSKNQFNVQGIENATSVRVFNLTGQMVANQQISNDQSTVSIAGLPQGFYWVELISANNNRQVLKLQIID